MQVFLNHNCNSDEEHYLASGRQKHFRDDFEERYVKKYTKNNVKQTTSLSGLLLKKWQKELKKYKEQKMLAVKKKLKSSVTEIRDHCHLEGNYRGAGHPTFKLNV